MRKQFESVTTEKLIKVFHKGTEDMDPRDIAAIRRLQAPYGLEHDPRVQHLISIREKILKRGEKKQKRRVVHG